MEYFEDHEIPGTGAVMQKRTVRHPLAPERRPFIWPTDQVRELATAVQLGMNVMLTGPTGCGKTALPRAICAELGWGMVRFNCDGETRVSNLRGMNVPAAKDGVLTLQYSLGDLAVCMRKGYTVLLDEIDAALPSVRFVLQSVLEEDNRTLHIPETGETIEAAPGFRVFATGNTIGYRATKRAMYAGTHLMNASFLDRFGMVIACGYPTKDEEIERVRVNVPDCASDVVDGICRVAQDLRTDDKFLSDFSTRRCVQWARLATQYASSACAPDGDPVLRSASAAVIRKLESATDVAVAQEVVRRIFGYPDDGAMAL